MSTSTAHNQLTVQDNIQNSHSGSLDNTTSITALKAIICILLSEALMLTADQQSKDLLAEQMQIKNLFINFASNYGSLCIATLCHELGHAIASKILNGDPIDVHLGANSTDGTPIISIGGISIDGFDPRKGYCNHEIPSQNRNEIHDTLNRLVQMGNNQVPTSQTPRSSNNDNQQDLAHLVNQLRQSPEFQAFRKKIVKVNPTKQAIILLAGGICGIIGRFATKTITHLITNRTSTNRASYQELLKQAMVHACKPDHIYLNQLLNLLVPFNAGKGQSDATKLWKDCVGIHPSIIRALETIAPTLEIAGEQYLAYNQAVNPNASAHTKTIIGLLNYLNGFIRFHV